MPRTVALAPVLALAAVAALTSCTTTDAAANGAGAAPTTAPPERGDAELLELARSSFADPEDQAAVALLDDGEVRTAFIGADAEGGVFEIGSITKTFTGLLLAEAIERGEVELGDTLGEHLDLGDSPASRVTLGELAAHQSGLPTFPSDPEWIAEREEGFFAGEDVIDETVDELLAEAAAEPLPDDAPPMYSNLGAALVGQALAAAAGVSYRELLEERILDPLGLDETVLPVDDDEVPSNLVPGFTPLGDPAEPSTLGAYAPAGGIASTVEDLARYAQAVIDGPFADSAALEPRPGLENGRIGYFWGVEDRSGRRLVSHGGMTAGFGTMLIVDRTRGTAAIVFANSAEEVDDIAEQVLAVAGR